ncbi:MAG: amino acid ABC transporter permease [Pseudomonadota bacterium]
MFDFRFYEIWREAEYLERLLYGVTLSFALTVSAALCGFALALLLANARRSARRRVRWPAGAYVEAIRNTPLIVQLFFVAFGLPMLFGFRWPFELAALVALSLNFSAYYAEIVRAGLDNMPVAQHEAAQALSLSSRQTHILVVLPQSLASVYPSLVSQFVFLFMTTGIISEIGIEELTWSGRFIADRTFRDFEVYIVLTLLYVAMAVGFRAFFAALAKRVFPWQHLRAGGS